LGEKLQQRPVQEEVFLDEAPSQVVCSPPSSLASSWSVLALSRRDLFQLQQARWQL
jgi:hypothetical protein